MDLNLVLELLLRTVLLVGFGFRLWGLVVVCLGFSVVSLRVIVGVVGWLLCVLRS